MTSIGRESAVKTLRIFNPHPGIFSYYDGRTGQRYFSEKRNWLDDGAFVLGISTYSIVSGNEALIFDAHITSDHAHAVVQHLRGLGVNKMTVVYSHSHNDHIAGAQAFGDTTIIGQERTASTLEQARDRLAQEEPPITVVLPTKLYSTQMTLEIGDITIELRNFDIHTADGTVLWIPSQRLLLAGDTLEDTATYISDPATLPTHQKELRRMAEFPIEKILPAHGSPERIAAGGYDPSFIDATLRYITAMIEPVEQPWAWTKPLSEVVAQDLSKGNLIYHSEYEEVHKSNIELMRKWRQKAV